MTQRRLFLIWSNPLFHDAALLLLKHPDISWVGAASDISAALEEIMRQQPDTILIEKTSDVIPAGVMEILEEETWDMRIIGLSLNNNELILFLREHQTVVEPGDLLQLVLG